MWSREKRLLMLALGGAGVVVGVALEAALDPIEATRPGVTVLVLVLAMLAFSGVCAHWFSRRIRRAEDIDERFQEIERRASRWSHGTLTAGVGTLALVLLLPWVRLPVAALLWALLVASVVVHELSVEYYSRRM